MGLISRKRAKTIIRIFLLMLLYKITIHQYFSSYVYANLKSILHEWSKSVSIIQSEKFCLLPNPLHRDSKVNTTSCLSCETIREIQFLRQTSFNKIELLCIQQGKPVIVTDVMFDWPKLDRIIDFSGGITKHEIKACYHETSIQRTSNNINDYWKIISNSHADNWFFAWKNCDLEGAKSIRHLYQQPYFTKFVLPASQINGIIISSNYLSNNYKKLYAESGKLLIIMQLIGTLTYRMQPREACKNLCNLIEGNLKESETLIFNSNLWEVYYLPGHKEINLSIITENHLTN